MKMPMDATPFHSVQKRLFLVRMIRPGIFVVFIGFLLMGALSRSAEIDLPALPMAQYQYSKFFHELVNVPSICVTGKTVNEFQVQQCQAYWNTLLVRTFWFSFPFLCLMAFLFFGFDYVWLTYRRAAKKIETGKGAFVGVVTNPPDVPNDIYGWFHCFRLMSAQVQKGQQIQVYIPLNAPKPEPGSRLSVADVGKRFGKQRYVGVIYTPHVAVVSTEKR